VIKSEKDIGSAPTDQVAILSWMAHWCLLLWETIALILSFLCLYAYKLETCTRKKMSKKRSVANWQITPFHTLSLLSITSIEYIRKQYGSTRLNWC